MVKLKEMRERRQLTQAELAAKSGVTQQAISKIESCNRKNPSISTMYKLANALRCTVDDLLNPPEESQE